MNSAKAGSNFCGLPCLQNSKERPGSPLPGLITRTWVRDHVFTIAFDIGQLLHLEVLSSQAILSSPKWMRKKSDSAEMSL